MSFICASLQTRGGWELARDAAEHCTAPPHMHTQLLPTPGLSLPSYLPSLIPFISIPRSYHPFFFTVLAPSIIFQDFFQLSTSFLYIFSPFLLQLVRVLRALSNSSRSIYEHTFLLYLPFLLPSTPTPFSHFLSYFLQVLLFVHIFPSFLNIHQCCPFHAFFSVFFTFPSVSISNIFLPISLSSLCCPFCSPASPSLHVSHRQQTASPSSSSSTPAEAEHLPEGTPAAYTPGQRWDGGIMVL